MLCSTWKSAICLFLLFCIPLFGTELPAPVHNPQAPNLPALAARSGYIFAGTVKAIERIEPRNKDAVAVMRITFSVQKGYVGVQTGQIIAINEWSGLWLTGDRYRQGERVVLFLYPLSKLGLTSPIPNGRFPVDSGGKVIFPPGSRPPGMPSLPGQMLPPNFRISLEDFGHLLRLPEQE
jgi:hypothetical protein